MHSLLHDDCGFDHNEKQDLVLGLSGLSDARTACSALEQYFEFLDGWHQKTFGNNTESCTDKQIALIEQRRKRHSRWAKRIKKYAMCEQDQ